MGWLAQTARSFAVPRSRALRVGARALLPTRRLAAVPSPVVSGGRWLCQDDPAAVPGSRPLDKPRLDSKRYRVIELPGNGLRCLLVSDPGADLSGAAMNIHAGSFQDPDDFQGLAHFHEHMLFLGTAKVLEASPLTIIPAVVSRRTRANAAFTRGALVPRRRRV